MQSSPSVTIDRKLKKVTLVLQLQTARPSRSSGKTMVIASTRGLQTSTETFAHRPICFTANVFFYPTNPPAKINEVGTSKKRNVVRTPRKLFGRT